MELLPARVTETVVGEVAAPVNTAGVGDARVARVPGPAELTPTRARLSARAVLLAAVAGAHCSVTQRPRPARLTLTCDWSVSVILGSDWSDSEMLGSDWSVSVIQGSDWSVSVILCSDWSFSVILGSD